MRRLALVCAVPALVTLAAATVFWPSRSAAAAAEMAAAATKLVQSLNAEQHQQACFAFADAERQKWGFVPGKYPGAQLADLNTAQKELVHALLRSSLSSAGYLKATSIVRLELVLKELSEQGGTPAPHRDPERYAVAVFGEPAADKPWGWRIQGHHVSLHFCGTGTDVVATTPAFLGTNPHVVRSGPLAGLRVLGAEEDLARALLASLDATQQKQAILDVKAPADVILGPARAATFLGEPKGLLASTMTEVQRALLWRIVREYAENLRPEFAEQQLARIQQADAGKIAFAWAGGTAVGQPHYYRLHGPTFVIEYDNTQDNANHVHTVFRDLQRDFGGDLLQEHLQHGHGK